MCSSMNRPNLTPIDVGLRNQNGNGRRRAVAPTSSPSARTASALAYLSRRPTSASMTTLNDRTMPRVLMWMPSGSGILGGHRVQFDLTSDALQRLGVPLRTSTDPDPDMTDVDVVHGFGLSADQVQRCRSMGKRVALSTIYGFGCDYHIKQPWRNQLRSLPWTVFRGARLSRAVLRSHGEVVASALPRLVLNCRGRWLLLRQMSYFPTPAAKRRHSVAISSVSNPVPHRTERCLHRTFHTR